MANARSSSALTIYSSIDKREETFAFNHSTTLEEMCVFIYKKFNIHANARFDLYVRESSSTFTQYVLNSLTFLETR